MMHTEKSCGAVVFTRSQNGIQYLLSCSKEGFWGFPKGHTEVGETEEETALREIREETGIDAVLLPGFRTTDAHPHIRPNKPPVMKYMVYFLAEYCGQIPKTQESEVSELRLVSYDDAMALFQFESSKRILAEANRFLQEKET